VSRYGLPFLWKAVRLDEVTGLLQMRNRYYSVETGRFLSGDPIGVWGDLGNLGNEYGYAWGRPLVVGDALGLQGLVFRINAFISSKHGEWLDEPGGPLWEFKGDNRGPGEGGDDESHRLAVEVEFSGAGGSGMTSRAYAISGISHARMKLIPEVCLHDMAQATHHSTSGSGRNGDWHTGHASASYPLAIVSPDIDIDYTIWVWCERAETFWIPGLGKTTVQKYNWSVRFRHDGFPDYELLVNGNLEGYWESADSGPGANLVGNSDHNVAIDGSSIVIMSRM
jgi:RHS repeat-associated protein